MSGVLPERVLVLRFAALPHTTVQRTQRYEMLAELYGDREVHQMIRLLTEAGLLEHGTSPRSCWLTERGRFEMGDRIVEASVR